MTRAFLVLLLIVAALGAIYELASPPPSVGVGLPERGKLRGKIHWRITRLSPSSPAGQVGIAPGDLVYLDSPYVNYRFMQPGDPIAITIDNGQQTYTQHVYAVVSPPAKKVLLIDKITPYVRFLSQIAMFVLAALLIWRNWGVVYARSLAVFLIWYGIALMASDFDAHFVGMVGVVTHYIVDYAIVYSLMEVMRFAISFPDPGREDLDRWHIRRWLYRTTPLFGLIMAADITAEITMWYRWGTNEPVLDTIWWVCQGYALVATVVALAVALSRAVGPERQRMLYITMTFLVGFAGGIATVLSVLTGLLLYPDAVKFRLTSIVIPFGFGYAILRHRVLDLSFAFNRGLVYAAIFICAVLVLTPLQVLIEGYLRGKMDIGANERLAEFVLRGAILLAFGLALPRARHLLGSFIEGMLFHQRRQRKQSLRNFADQLQFVSELDDLLKMTIDQIDKNADASAVAVYIAEKVGPYHLKASSFEMPPAEISENDLAVLHMRANPTPVDLSTFDTLIPGNDAFPMIVRGYLIGFLVCGPKRLEETYPPDEMETLRALAQSTGVAIDVKIANTDREIAQRNLVVEQKRALDEMKRFNTAYSRFVPEQFLDYLDKASILEVELGDQTQREMTVLFSDIRSFTTLSESMTPKENFNFLNAYLKRVGPVIRREGRGFIDKYIGDAVMALFPNSADDALVASIAMQRDLERYNKERARANYPPITVGIGLHTGTLMLGTIGEHERMETTVISDNVNLASRIESLTKRYHVSIMISGATHTRLGDPSIYDMRCLGKLQVKGKATTTRIYEVYDADPPDLALHKKSTRDQFDAAMELWELGKFQEAYDAFAVLSRMHAGDGPAAYYRMRCAELVSTPIMDWDGVERMESK